MKKKVSIIIPVYNVEKYICRCLESVINQDYKNLEIIIVNDGTQDNSYEICNKYAKLDKRIKLINQKNGGLSDARNTGVKMATGRYLAFLDSDDYVDKDTYSTLVNLMEQNNADISKINYRKIKIKDNVYTEYEEKKSYNNNDNSVKIYNKEDALKEILLDYKIQNYVWDKLYKKELFDDVQFPVRKNYEDIAIQYKVFSKINKMVLGNNVKYNYVIREDSIVNLASEKTLSDCIEIIRERYKILKIENIQEYNTYGYIKILMSIYKTGLDLGYTGILKEIETEIKDIKEMYNYNEKFIDSNLDEDKKELLKFLIKKEKNI